MRGERLVVGVVNRSGYDTRDLREFFAAGLRARRVSGRVLVVVTSSPIYSRGCATVGGDVISIAIASPSRLCYRRLSRMFDHEVSHKLGTDHGAMSERDLYSLGRTSGWARDWESGRRRIRYRGRARRQL